MIYARVGAVLFALWGLLHVVGGATIMLAAAESPDQGFAMYRQSTGHYGPLAGHILGYLAYSFVWIGIVVTVIAVRFNWANSERGLMLNTALVGLTDLGLVIFLLWPGFLTWGDGAPGLVLFVAAAIFGGIGCHSESISDGIVATSAD